jgi:hypothetical protein
MGVLAHQLVVTPSHGPGDLSPLGCKSEKAEGALFPYQNPLDSFLFRGLRLCESQSVTTQLHFSPVPRGPNTDLALPGAPSDPQALDSGEGAAQSWAHRRLPSDV